MEIYPCIPTIPQHGYTVHHSVPKSTTVPVPALPVLENPWVFPYLCRTLLTHPNGWEDAQQSQIHYAAVLAGLVPDTKDGQNRVQFMTECEARLHFCINNGLAADAKMVSVFWHPWWRVHLMEWICYRLRRELSSSRLGGTVDLSTYYLSLSLSSFQEITHPECVTISQILIYFETYNSSALGLVQGSTLVICQAQTFFESKFKLLALDN